MVAYEGHLLVTVDGSGHHGEVMTLNVVRGQNFYEKLAARSCYMTCISLLVLR
jgi:hypothetical protein